MDRLDRVEKMLEELVASQKETDALIKETDALIKENAKALKELAASQKETDAQLAETDAKLERIGDMLANIGLNNGHFAEEYFYQTLKRKLKVSHLEFDSIQRRIRRERISGEIDILLINGDSVLILEVKYKAHPEEIGEIKERKIQFLQNNFQEYKNFKVYFGIATMVTNEQLIKNSKQEDIFLLTQVGDDLEVLNKQAVAC